MVFTPHVFYGFLIHLVCLIKVNFFPILYWLVKQKNIRCIFMNSTKRSVVMLRYSTAHDFYGITMQKFQVIYFFLASGLSSAFVAQLTLHEPGRGGGMDYWIQFDLQ